MHPITEGTLLTINQDIKQFKKGQTVTVNRITRMITTDVIEVWYMIEVGYCRGHEYELIEMKYLSPFENI